MHEAYIISLFVVCVLPSFVAWSERQSKEGWVTWAGGLKMDDDCLDSSLGLYDSMSIRPGVTILNFLLVNPFVDSTLLWSCHVGSEYGGVEVIPRYEAFRVLD